MSAPSLTKHLGPLRRRLSPPFLPIFPPVAFFFSPTLDPMLPHSSALLYGRGGGTIQTNETASTILFTTDRYHSPAPGKRESATDYYNYTHHNNNTFIDDTGPSFFNDEIKILATRLTPARARVYA